MRNILLLCILLFSGIAAADVVEPANSEPESSEPESSEPESSESESSDDAEDDDTDEQAEEGKGCAIVTATASSVLILAALGVVGWRREA